MPEKVIQLLQAEAVPDGSTFGTTPARGIALRAGWQPVAPGSTVVSVDEAFAAECSRQGALAAEEVLGKERQAFLDEGGMKRLAEIAERLTQTLADHDVDRLLAEQFKSQVRQAIKELRPVAEIREMEGWARSKLEDVRLHQAQIDQLEAMLVEERGQVRAALGRRLQAAAAEHAYKHAERAAKVEAEALAAFEPLWKERLAQQAMAVAADRHLVEGYLDSLPLPEPVRPAATKAADINPSILSIMQELEQKSC